jgi:hypothetical protein
MHAVSPQTFLEMLGGLLFAMAVLFALVSLLPSIRSAALRLSAIVSLSALALFANHWTGYFAAIFIIATAVTELEFLHILAAIIRGDKNYFDFRREFLTREEALQKTRQDTEVDREEFPAKGEAPVDESVSRPLRIPSRASFSHGRIMALAFQLEERALAWFERRTGFTVQRYVRFRGEAGVVEVDGVVEGRRGAPDTLVEIKWIRNPHGFLLRHMAERFAEIPRRYKEITKREAELVLLLIAPAQAAIPESQLARVRERLSSAGVKHRIVIATYQDLGVVAAEDTERASEGQPASEAS